MRYAVNGSDHKRQFEFELSSWCCCHVATCRHMPKIDATQPLSANRNIHKFAKYPSINYITSKRTQLHKSSCHLTLTHAPASLFLFCLFYLSLSLRIVYSFSALCSLCVSSKTGQRITTIQLDGVQYFVSRMNPYSPELNYFLAYQYCRSLGLQLASFETKEKVESMSQYLQNAGYSKYDFWTSGNRLGTGMFLWMSTGLPFNATFDYFENSNDAVKAGLLDPVDHNSNTSPQRTARDR